MAKQPASIDEDKRASEYLANERTFLAWIRTSIAIISLGFVVAKFSLWLHQLGTQLQPNLPSPTSTGASMPIGITMMALGGMLAMLAAWSYHAVNRDIENGIVRADRGLVVLITAVVAFLCIAMIVYMLLTAQRA